MHRQQEEIVFVTYLRHSACADKLSNHWCIERTRCLFGSVGNLIEFLRRRQVQYVNSCSNARKFLLEFFRRTSSLSPRQRLRKCSLSAATGRQPEDSREATSMRPCWRPVKVASTSQPATCGEDKGRFCHESDPRRFDQLVCAPPPDFNIKYSKGASEEADEEMQQRLEQLLR